MRFVNRDDKAKTATVVVGRGYMRRGTAVPLYCPVCRENGESCRWFDVHSLHGRVEHKCEKCKWLFTIIFDASEPAGQEVYPIKQD